MIIKFSGISVLDPKRTQKTLIKLIFTGFNLWRSLKSVASVCWLQTEHRKHGLNRFSQI